jgi:glycosyltransferase involved in cell wall biosynthesis
MKILELCTSDGVGGLELYVVRTTEALHRLQCDVLAAVRPGTMLQTRLEEGALPLVELPRRSRTLPLLAARRLARLLERHEIDLVHMHWGHDLFLAALAKRLSKRPVKLVYTRQMALTRSKRDFYHRFLYGQIDLYLTITDKLSDQAHEFLPLPTERVSRLYYGVEAPGAPLSPEQRQTMREAWGVPDDAMLVGLFGRMEPYKGQHLFIEALARAKREGLNVYGLLVGHEMETGYSDILKNQAAALGVLERMVFRGFTKDPKPWMQSCDAVLLATVEETFGLVLPEAMRAGVAVIGSNRGGVLEIIDHGKNGLLFESEDSVSLYEQIKRYASDQTFLRAMAQAGKADADQRFDVAHHYASLKEILQALTVTSATQV